MESNIELKEIDIKNHTCYYFDDIINILILIIFYWMKKRNEIFSFMMFHRKL